MLLVFHMEKDILTPGVKVSIYYIWDNFRDQHHSPSSLYIQETNLKDTGENHENKSK